MFKVGLTGGIASGKSAVSSWFAEKGITVIDADKIVHELYSSPTMIQAIIKALGSEYIDGSQVNRALLGEKVFRNPQARKKLEEIIHPLVKKEILAQCQAAEDRKEKIVIIDIPLLFEVGWERFVDEVWVVYVSPDIQCKRLMARNGLTAKAAEMRILSQMPIAEKAKKADRVIDNSGNWEETEKHLSQIWQEIQSKFA
ncbi:MAG TPA: dephospho-CoA kinase [Peptococcaceae bacterium]|nr:dephospho-CoA kinase [Peptococcaceae bacterium]